MPMTFNPIFANWKNSWKNSEKQKTNIVLAIGRESLKASDAASAIEQLNTKIDNLTAQIDNLKKKIKSESADGGRRELTTVKEIIEALNSKIDAGLNDEEKSVVVRTLVKEIIIDYELVEGKKLTLAQIHYLFDKKDSFSSVDSPLMNA